MGTESIHRLSQIKPSDSYKLFIYYQYVNCIRQMSPAHPTIDLRTMQAAATNACALLKVLANRDRLLLMCRLSQDELSVGELEEQLDIRQPTLSQQLAVLRENGLVTTRRDGKNIFYSVASTQALAVMTVLYQQFCAGAGAPPAP